MLLLPISWAYGVLANGFVLSHLWTWFVIPVAASTAGVTLTPIGVLMGAAVMSVARFLTWNGFNAEDPERPKSLMARIQVMIAVIIMPWVTLFFGWILWLCM